MPYQLQTCPLATELELLEDTTTDELELELAGAELVVPPIMPYGAGCPLHVLRETQLC